MDSRFSEHKLFLFSAVAILDSTGWVIPYYVSVSVAQPCPTLCDHRDFSPPGSSVHGKSQVRITAMGCHFLLQGVFQTQKLNLSFLHKEADSLPLSHLGNPDLIKINSNQCGLKHVYLDSLGALVHIIPFKDLNWYRGQSGQPTPAGKNELNCVLVLHVPSVKNRSLLFTFYWRK